MLKLQSKETDKVEIIQQQIRELQKVLLGYKRNLNRGHRLFEINLVDNTIVEAKFEVDNVLKWNDAVSKNNSQRKKKVIVEENCVYLFGLNKKSILKQLEKGGVNDTV